MVRVLIDEDIDIEFRHHVAESAAVETVQYRGWKGIKNGDLLRRAESDFDAFITMDDNLPHQQNLAAFDLCVLILRARSKKLPDLIDCLPALKVAMMDLKSGTAVRIYPPDSGSA